MVSKFIILTNILLASGILAVPFSSSPLHHRLTRLRRENLQARPISYIDTSQSADVLYSTNWAGDVRNESEGTFTTVTGTLTVPTLTRPDGSGVAWVGIDGKSCLQAILQTGISFSITDGQASYQAWYEWFPDDAVYFDGFNISAGDKIRATVAAYSKTSGKAVIENLTTNKTVTQELSSSYALCEQDAEWIVEDFLQDGIRVPFANFGKIEFTNALATGSGGRNYTPDGATVVDIKQNNTILTSVSASGDTLTVIHV